jgi:hypothetical protein
MISIQEIIKSDNKRMDILRIVASLKLPDCYVAAGFVRNMVWDYIHGYDLTPLNDVDVIYFDKVGQYLTDSIQHQLSLLKPSIKWEVKNQALMHIRNGDKPYINSMDAMTYWPEKETAVGVRLLEDGEIELSAPFGTRSLFKGYITFNPKRSFSVFQQRLCSKKWVEKWPRLRVITDQTEQKRKKSH